MQISFRLKLSAKFVLWGGVRNAKLVSIVLHSFYLFPFARGVHISFAYANSGQFFVVLHVSHVSPVPLKFYV